MRVHLKGIHRVKVKLASGAIATYYYAWRKGPRLVGEPGSPEFIASYMAAHASRREPDRASFHSIIVGYKASQDFLRLKPRTKSDYLQHIAKIEEKFGDLPLAALDDARVTRDFLEWRDSMANSPRQADYAWMVLMRLLSWARARGLTLYRPPERVERLYHADRSEKIWDENHLAAFMAKASEPLQRALVLALETGQRPGDLLLLPWSAYDGQWIRLRQAKTGRRVNIPVTRRLRAVLVLQCHKLRRFRVWLSAQYGHRGSIRAIATIRRRWTLAIELGTCRWVRIGGAAGSVTGGNGRFFEQSGGTRC